MELSLTTDRKGKNPVSIDMAQPSSAKSSPTARRTVQELARAATGRTVEERMLVDGARRLMRARHKIAGMVPHGLFRDATWGIMLELFVNSEEGGVLYVKQLLLASGESAAAAMRLIDRLEKVDLLRRVPDTLDHRRVIVCMTERGRALMITWLQQIYADPAELRTLIDDSSATPRAYQPRRSTDSA